MPRGGASSRIRRAGPGLEITSSRGASPGERALRVLLRALFSIVLVLPRLRSLRRTRNWNWIRVALFLAATAIAMLVGGWWRAIALVPAIPAIVLRRTTDPDRERRMQRALGAEYLLNGGEWGGGTGVDDGLALGTPLYLMLRGPHLLLVPRDGNGEVHSAARIEGIRRILVEGEEYVPVYVSEAKQPPVRESRVDRLAVVELILEPGPGRLFRFRYRGPFARHLAETAAHAIFSERSQQLRSRPASRVPGPARPHSVASGLDLV